MAAAVGGNAIENFTYGTPRTTAAGTTTSGSGSSFLVAFLTANGDTVTSVTDAYSNTYSVVTTVVETVNGNKMWVYQATNGSGGTNHTVTVTMSSGGVAKISFTEITGAATASIVDQSNAVHDNATPYSCAITTTVADSIAIAYATVIDGAGSGTYTANGGFTAYQNNATTHPMAAAYKVLSATGTEDPAWTHSTKSYSALITLNVKAAAAASGQPTMRRFGGVPGMTPGPQSFGRGW